MNTIALIINAIVCLLYPILVIALCFVEKETLLDDSVADRIGVLYEDLDLKKKGMIVLSHHIASITRRLIFAVVLVFATAYPVF